MNITLKRSWMHGSLEALKSFSTSASVAASQAIELMEAASSIKDVECFYMEDLAYIDDYYYLFIRENYQFIVGALVIDLITIDSAEIGVKSYD